MTTHDDPLVFFGIPALAVLLVGLLMWAMFRVERETAPPIRRRRVWAVALGAGLWLSGLAAMAASGVLGRFESRPPPMLLAVLSLFVVSLGLALSSYGRRLALGLPLWLLVGVQGFRLPLELLMHRAAQQGIMPSVMSYSGYNFDIVSGISALLLGGILVRRRLPLFVLAAWNLMGLMLLFAITGIALAATPIFRAFGDDQLNIWVTRFPYVWLLVMVGSALLGHILIARRLITEWRGAASTDPSHSPVPSSGVQ